jgi:CBS domain-containing protein
VTEPTLVLLEDLAVGAMASREVLCVGPAHPIRRVAQMMADRNVGSAVVLTEDGRPGIITERDLLRALADGVDPESTAVESYMTATAITASPNWSAQEAARCMLARNFRHLVVVGDQGRVEGVLSIRDLFAALLGRSPGVA